MKVVDTLRICPLTHGGPDNKAVVYGHYVPNRTCIRVASRRVWVYEPAWEKGKER